MGISPIQLLIVLVIVVLIFGGKRLRTLGSDVGQAIKGFKEATREEKDDKEVIDAGKAERIEHVEGPAISGEIKSAQEKTSRE